MKWTQFSGSFSFLRHWVLFRTGSYSGFPCRLADQKLLNLPMSFSTIVDSRPLFHLLNFLIRTLHVDIKTLTLGNITIFTK